MKVLNCYFSAFLGFVAGIVISIAILFCMVWYVLLEYPVPWKIIEPTNPNFVIEEFKFSDYDNEKSLKNALDKMFPVGTSREKVEEVLVNKARARWRKNDKLKSSLKEENDDQVYYYSFKNFRSFVFEYIALGVPEGEFSWKVTVVYDAQDKLKSIYVI